MIGESQWIALVRSHAEVLVDDEVVLPAFRKFCKVRNQSLYVLSISVFCNIFQNFFLFSEESLIIELHPLNLSIASNFTASYFAASPTSGCQKGEAEHCKCA